MQSLETRARDWDRDKSWDFRDRDFKKRVSRRVSRLHHWRRDQWSAQKIRFWTFYICFVVHSGGA